MTLPDKMKKGIILVENLKRHFQWKQEQIKNKNLESMEGRIVTVEDGQQSMDEILISILHEVQESLQMWDNTPIEGVDGMTPKQYFESLKTMRDFIDLLSILNKLSKHVYTPAMVENVKRIVEKEKGEFYRILSNVQIDESRELNSRQQAVISIALLSPDEAYLPALKNILIQFEYDRTSSESYFNVLEVYVQIGGKALEELFSLIEDCRNFPGNYHSPDFLKKHAIVTLAKASADKKSDRVFQLLKDCFMESEDKLFEANAFKLYGDTMAVPGLRAYVQENLEQLSLFEYEVLREAILSLGGAVQEFDRYFKSIDQKEE